MAVIRSLEKTYMLKSVGIPEYYLGENMEFLGESWKNQGLGLAISAKTYIQNTEDDSAKYRSIIGCCIWIIVLGRFDIAYATSATSKFNMLPREGHLKSVKIILSYLKTFPKGRVIIHMSYPDHSVYPVEDHSNWM
jgi:hypothetical protein